MANIVVLDKTEINSFTDDLIQYHKEIINGIYKVNSQIRIVCTDGKMFSLEKTNRKICSLLDTIDKEILSNMKTTLWDSTQCATDLIQIMHGLDN